MISTAATPALLSSAGPWSTIAFTTLYAVLPLPELELLLPPELLLELELELPPELLLLLLLLLLEVVITAPPPPPQPASSRDTRIRLANRFRKGSISVVR